MSDSNHNGNGSRQRYGRRVSEGQASVDPATKVKEAAPNYGRNFLPQIVTFSGMQSAYSHVYRNPDEAIRHSIDNARFMRNDCSIMECLEARQRAVALLNWHVEPEDKDDPQQEQLVTDLTSILEKIKRFTEYRRNLLEAIWCGRTAIQNRWERRKIGGEMRFCIRNWTPVNGDKLAFRFDDGSGKHDPDQIGIRVGGAFSQRDAIAGDRVIEMTDFGQAYFLEPWERSLLTVHKHMIEDGAFEDPISAGRIHGVGVRDRIYWCWFQKQETMAQLMEVIQRTGTGFTIYYYESGNDKAKQEMLNIAQKQGPTNVILIPRMAGDDALNANGIDRIEPSTAGIDAMKSIIHEFFGHQIKRYILGQILSSESAATGLGSGVADLHQDTFAAIVQYDAVNLEETITEEIVLPLIRYNFPWAQDLNILFKIDTKDNDAEKKLQAYKSAWDMGCRLKASDVMDVIGASVPDEDDEVLQNPSMQQQQRLWEQAHPGDLGKDGSVQGADGQPAPEGSVEDMFGPLAGELGGDQQGPDGGGDQPQSGGPPGRGPQQYARQQVKSSPGQKPLFENDTHRENARKKWDENLHPRDDGGQFAEKGSGHVATATEAPAGVRRQTAKSSPGQQLLGLAGDAAEQAGKPFELSGKPNPEKGLDVPTLGKGKQVDLFAGRGDSPGQTSFFDDVDPAAKNVPDEGQPTIPDKRPWHGWSAEDMSMRPMSTHNPDWYEGAPTSGGMKMRVLNHGDGTYSAWKEFPNNPELKMPVSNGKDAEGTMNNIWRGGVGIGSGTPEMESLISKGMAKEMGEYSPKPAKELPTDRPGPTSSTFQPSGPAPGDDSGGAPSVEQPQYTTDDPHLARAADVLKRIPKVSAKGLSVQLNGEVSEEHAQELLDKLRGENPVEQPAAKPTSQFQTAGEAAKAGKSYAEWQGNAHDAFTNEEIDEDHPAWKAVQSGTAPSVQEYNDAKSLHGQHVEFYNYGNNKKEHGQVTDVADDGKTVTVTRANGSTYKTSADALGHLGATIQHRSDKGKEHPAGLAYLAPKLAAEQHANQENIGETMKRHGLNPMNLAAREAIAVERAKLVEAEKPKPKEPSEARAKAMERSKEVNSPALQSAITQAHRQLHEAGLAEKPAKEPKARATRTKLVEDFGEKIGGARKDRAFKTGPREKVEKPKDDRPGWKRRYRVAEDANKPGEYFVVDERTKQPHGDGDRGNANSFSKHLERLMGKGSGVTNFKSKEAAESAIAQIEVNRNHGITKHGDEYQIYRKIGERKRPVVRGGFKSYEEANNFLKEHPEEIIEHEFPDYETYQYLDRVERVGGPKHRDGDAKTSDFQKAFNFRGGEFGNWQAGKDGQTSLNHAYDALHDLAEVLNLPTKAISLNGDLSIGFGSRGTGGLHSARAHYEPDKSVINLTKMKGAGSLGHEWFHALDHYLSKQAGSDSHTTAGLRSGKLRPEVAQALKDVHDAISTKEVTTPVTAPKTNPKRDEEQEAARARSRENGVQISFPSTVEDHLWNLRVGMQQAAAYRKKKIDPKMLKEFDDLSAKIAEGGHGKPTVVESAGPFGLGRSTFENVEKLNQLHKKIVGRGFHTNDDHSPGKKLYWTIKHDEMAKQRIKDAAAGKTETGRVKTDYYNEARKLDQAKMGDYYQSPEEMGARAFEAYIMDKLGGAGRRNDYLGAKADNKYYVLMGGKPFPEGDERHAINAAFDRLFAALKHESRSDEKGEHVRLYAKEKN